MIIFDTYFLFEICKIFFYNFEKLIEIVYSRIASMNTQLDFVGKLSFNLTIQTIHL